MIRILKPAILGSLSFLLVGELAATEWNVSLWGQRRAFTEHVEKLAELVSEKTDGKFTLNLSYGGLSASRENLDGIAIGAFEMAQICAGYHGDKNPSITVLELPFLGVNLLEQESAVSRGVYQHPAVMADLARWNATLLMPTPQPQYNIAGVGDPPRRVAEFDGLAVRALGGIGSAMKAVGAVPTSMAAPEIRLALDTGVITAVAAAPHAHMAFGVADVATWWTTNLNPGTGNCPIVVNSDALHALHETERDALLSSVDTALDHFISFYNGHTLARWESVLDNNGIERITYSDEELAAFREAVADQAASDWIENNTARGLPAQELYNLVVSLAGS
ncbi:MAG: C4-dicarboxylate ABC transporter substrate-binding protein [Rhodobacteraceae bacterium]|nr:C4-dicarboxylate ABC transporter substrate-binding protein [Paracoccaceae bacterium]